MPPSTSGKVAPRSPANRRSPKDLPPEIEPDSKPKPRLSALRLKFDEENLVPNAGLVLASVLSGALGVEGLVSKLLTRAGNTKLANAGAKIMTILLAMLAGGDSIDDCDVLRAGSTQAVIEQRVLAPSTIGTFLRAFTWKGVAQMMSVFHEITLRAWAVGANPATWSRVVVDIDSFCGQVYGKRKEGTGFGYRRFLCYHPLLATLPKTGEIIHIRCRRGNANTQLGLEKFIREIIDLMRRGGVAMEQLYIRADAGMQNERVFRLLDSIGARFSIGVHVNKAVRAIIEALPDGSKLPDGTPNPTFDPKSLVHGAWSKLLKYPAGGEAWAAEAVYHGWRLIIRRVRADDKLRKKGVEWLYFAFVTNNRIDPLLVMDGDHRDHAAIEPVIADNKAQGLAHFPSGKLIANMVWTILAALSHNIGRWVSTIGLPGERPCTARKRRMEFFSVPGKMKYHARQWTLHLPDNWPWRGRFEQAFERLQALPTLT